MYTSFIKSRFAALALAVSVACPLPAAFGAQPALDPTDPTNPTNVDGQNVVIYKEAGAYTPFPSLYQEEDGSLIVQFSRRPQRSHIDISGQTILRFKSRDGGLTWGKIPVDTPLGLPAWKTQSGEWVRIVDKGWQYVEASRREELEKQGASVRDAGKGKIAYLTADYAVQRSEDGGKTWTGKTFRAPGYVRTLYHHFPTHTSLLTSGGVRLRVLYGKAVGSDKVENFVLRSEDDGKTWEFVRVQPNGPEEVGMGESALVETADKRLLLMIRSEPTGYLWQSFSDDFGKTWSRPASSGITGHPPHLLRLPGGRLLCTYGYRRPPMGVRACVSDDNGKTWDIGSELVLRADGKHRPADQGYPTTALLADGSLFTSYYITLEDNITHIAGTKWKLPAPSATSNTR